MNARPILFSGEMVRALLEGRKTQTRRVIKGPRSQDSRISRYLFNVRNWWRAFSGGGHVPFLDVKCPYGQPGDLLYVRETWAHYQTINHRRRPDGAAFDEVSDGLAAYRADGHESIDDLRAHILATSDAEAVEINGDRWRPSIHMPRWASRITLKITDVRVQRVQEIYPADAIAEGMAPVSLFDLDCESRNPVDDFHELWDSLNAPRGFDWDKNPWVWALTFEVINANVDSVLERAA